VQNALHHTAFYLLASGPPDQVGLGHALHMHHPVLPSSTSTSSFSPDDLLIGR
jgi:hypothetical protein